MHAVRALIAIKKIVFFGQRSLDFQYVQVFLPLKVNLDVVGIDVDVFGNDRNQVALQRRQIVGLMAAAPGSFMGQDDLQALSGHARRFFLFTEQE